VAYFFTEITGREPVKNRLLDIIGSSATPSEVLGSILFELVEKGSICGDAVNRIDNVLQPLSAIPTHGVQ